MKAVVTGGAGFIGTHLVKALQEKGDEVAVVDIKTGSDIRKPDDLKKAFVGADYVFHLAALPRVQYSIEHPTETNETNVVGTLNVLVAARDGGVTKVIYSGSSSAYGNQTEMPLRETMQANPLSPYGLQKYVGELYCRVFSEVYNLPTISLRYFNVYGPGADPNGAYALVIAKFIEQRKRGEPMTIAGSGENTRDYTHVRDVVRANLLAAGSGKVERGEVINIGAGNNVSVNKVAELIGGPTTTVEARLEPKDTRADNSLAKELLGWGPTITVENGIAELKKLAGLV